MHYLSLKQLTLTEKGFFQNSNYKTLGRVPITFVKTKPIKTIRFFSTRFYDFTLGNDDIRCIKRIVQGIPEYFTTRENIKLIKTNDK